MLLETHHLFKGFRQPDGEHLLVLKDVCISLDKGKSAALLGESGSGKSTLLHLIAGLDRPDEGHIRFDHHDYKQLDEKQLNAIRRKDLSLIFQQYHLIPSISVRDNIQLQAKLTGNLDQEYFRYLVERLSLARHLNHHPHQLSGGQQQRVAIARSLLHRPKLVLADEPTGNLDEASSKVVMQTFIELIKENQTSLLMVTHSADMALYCDYQWRLQHGQVLQP